MLIQGRAATSRFSMRVVACTMLIMAMVITLRAVTHASDPASRFCVPLEDNSAQISALLKRVGDLYEGKQHKRWKHIVDTVIDPNDFDNDPNTKARQVRVWKEEEKYIDTLEYKIFEVQQCGAISQVTTRVWWRDRNPGLPTTEHGVDDEHTWWTWRVGKWSKTTEYDRWIASFGKTLHSPKDDPTPIYWVESPREEFVVVWSQPIE